MASRESTILSLVNQIYEASLDPSRWPSFLSSLVTAFEGEAAWIFSKDIIRSDGAIAAQIGVEERFLKSFEEYKPNNVFFERSQVLPEGAFLSKGIVDPALYEKGEFYNEWVRPQGFYDFAGTNVVMTDDLVTGVSLFRGPRPGSFNSADIRDWNILMPHIRQAVHIRRRLFALDLSRGGALEALFRLTLGLIIARPNGEVLFCNEVAEQIFKLDRGLRVRCNRLCGESPAATAALVNMLELVAKTSVGAGTHPGGLIPLPCVSGAPLPVLISPVHSENILADRAGPVAMLLLSDPQGRRHANEGDLARIFGLTPAEARLVTALTDGLSVAEYATNAGISTHTARAQLKEVFAKTGEHRQTALVRRVLTDPILSGPAQAGRP